MENKPVIIGLKMSDGYVTLAVMIDDDEAGYSIEVDLTAEECYDLMLGLREGIERLLDSAKEDKEEVHKAKRETFKVIKGGKDDTIH